MQCNSWSSAKTSAGLHQACGRSPDNSTASLTIWALSHSTYPCCYKVITRNHSSPIVYEQLWTNEYFIAMGTTWKNIGEKTEQNSGGLRPSPSWSWPHKKSWSCWAWWCSFFQLLACSSGEALCTPHTQRLKVLEKGRRIFHNGWFGVWWVCFS